MTERETEKKALTITKRIDTTGKNSTTAQNVWVYSMENMHSTKYIHNYFCKCGHNFKDTTTINQPFPPNVSCSQCNNTLFLDLNAFKEGQFLHDSRQISWGIEVFENRTVWCVYVYIDLPVHTHKEEVVLQRKKILRCYVYKNTKHQIVKPYELSYYTYIANRYNLMRYAKENRLELVALKALYEFLLEHKNENISWLKKEDLSYFSVGGRLQCIHYFLHHSHLQEFNFYLWDMVFLQNYTKQFNSELKMLDFIANHRKEKSVKKALYASYETAINVLYYNPHSDFVFSRSIQDPNLLVQLLSIDLTIKKTLFSDADYLEGMVWHLLSF